MRKCKILLTCLICVSALNITSCDDGTTSLLISEVYEADGNDRALELYNFTEKEVDLKKYSIDIYTNKGTEPKYKIPLSGKLAPNETFVIAYPTASKGVLEKADMTSNDLMFNGSQAITLLKNKTVVDQIGTIGTGVKFYENFTYVRKVDYLLPNPIFDEYEWIRYAKGNQKYLGNAINSVTPEELLEGPKLTPEDYAKPYFKDESKTLGGGGVATVKVKAYGDGDTTTFIFPEDFVFDYDKNNPNILRIRYQNVDTRETMSNMTQEWGLPAKYFTNDRLKAAKKIEVQSVEGGPIYETFGRGLGWVWIDGKLQNYELAKNGLTENAFSAIDTITYKDIPYTSYIYNGCLYATKMNLGLFGTQLDPYWNYNTNSPK